MLQYCGTASFLDESLFDTSRLGGWVQILESPQPSGYHEFVEGP